MCGEMENVFPKRGDSGRIAAMIVRRILAPEWEKSELPGEKTPRSPSLVCHYRYTCSILILNPYFAPRWTAFLNNKRGREKTCAPAGWGVCLKEDPLSVV
jgi:hypothetical protein